MKTIIFVYVIIACIYAMLNTATILIFVNLRKTGYPAIDKSADKSKAAFNWFIARKGPIKGRLYIVYLGFNGGFIWPYMILRKIFKKEEN